MKNTKDSNGITLIALIITVIVLLILAGTAVSISLNGEDIFSKTSNARSAWNEAVAIENSTLNDLMTILNQVGEEKLAPGLYYYDNNELVASWDELINPETNILKVEDGVLSTRPNGDGSCQGYLTYIIDKNNTAVGDRLIRIIIPEGVTKIAPMTFYGCQTLKKVNLPNTLTELGQHVFQTCPLLEEITLPDSLTTMDNYAFAYDDNLEKVKLSNSLTALNNYTFDGQNKIKYIEIPSSIIGISQYGLPSGIEKIKINGNPIVTSYGLSNCTRLNTIILGDGFQVLKPSFGFSSTVRVIEIGNDVTQIQDGTFSNCSNLTDIYFRGSETEWNAISVEVTHGNNILATAHMHFNSSVPE